MAHTKTNTQNNTKTRKTTRHTRHLEKKYILCFSDCILFYIFLNDIATKRTIHMCRTVIKVYKHNNF